MVADRVLLLSCFHQTSIGGNAIGFGYSNVQVHSILGLAGRMVKGWHKDLCSLALAG